MRSRFTFALLAMTGLCAYVPTEKVAFTAGPQQQMIVRDGRNAIVSKRRGSTVMVSAASRELASGRRPVFVVAVQNTGKTPAEFRVSGVSAVQTQDNAPSRAMAIVPYEQLVSEERARQVASAVLVGLAVVGNSVSAQHASYTRSGRYSPLAGAINGARADSLNADLIAGTLITGEVNLAALEQDILKDNTVMPAEWVGGQLHMEPPAGDSAQVKAYVITVPVGSDVHEIVVRQGQGV
jgi:hypothetical protein